MRTFSREKRDILQEKRDIFLVTHALQALSKKTAKREIVFFRRRY